MQDVIWITLGGSIDSLHDEVKHQELMRDFDRLINATPSSKKNYSMGVDLSRDLILEGKEKVRQNNDWRRGSKRFSGYTNSTGI